MHPKCNIRTIPILKEGDRKLYHKVVKGVNLEGVKVDDVVLALWADKSIAAISRELYRSLSQANPDLPFEKKPFRFPSDPIPQTTLNLKVALEPEGAN